MSLRYRLILPIALVLLVSLILGGGLAWLHAVRSVATEMDAALAVGRHTVETVIPFMGKGEEGDADLRQLVGTFDGDRHLRASLIGPDGKRLVSSTLFVPPEPVPSWFARALGTDQPAARLPLPGGQSATAIELETDTGNELTEVWTEFGDDMQMLLVFSAVTFPMLYWITGKALRPLGRVSVALTDISPGMSIRPIAETGPPEIVALARGFNAMIDRLALAETRNRRLNDQLSTIQEEERAEIARDLHDEIGPYLFAMGVDAAAVQKAAEAHGQVEMVAQIRSVREGVAHVQQQVKAILGRLRSGNLVEFGLKQALENLTSFWQSRHGEVAIAVTMSGTEGGFAEEFEGAIYRIVQESLNNAMRHGRPRRVTIAVDASSRHEVLVQVADDGSGLKRSPDSRGWGVRGMIERVTALGGNLDIQERKNGTGVVVTARLPYPPNAGNLAA